MHAPMFPTRSLQPYRQGESAFRSFLHAQHSMCMSVRLNHTGNFWQTGMCHVCAPKTKYWVFDAD